LNRHLDESDVETVILRRQEDSLPGSLQHLKICQGGSLEAAKEEQEVQ